MKNLIKTLVVGIMLATPTLVQAGVPYVSGSLGLAMPNGDASNFDNGLGLNGAIGIQSNEFRAECELGYQSHDRSTYYGDVEASMFTVMANMYYDIFTYGELATTYVLGGIGMANIDYYGSDSYFAFQIGAGSSSKLSDNVSLDIEYRYLKPTDVNYGLEIETHNIMLGLRTTL